MKLWVFGCSYSISSSFKHKDLWDYDKNWIDVVAENLNIDKNNINNCSQFGISNDVIFYSLLQNFSKISEGDLVIIQTTSSARKRFFPEDPALSNFTNMRKGARSKEQETALKHYITYLQNDQLDSIQLTAYIYAIMYMRQGAPSSKFLFLPGFGTAPEATGNLTENVCDNEFSSPDVINKFYLKLGWDPRLNHMSMENHLVLADKVTDYFKNGTALDLTTGFKSNIFREDNI